MSSLTRSFNNSPSRSDSNYKMCVIESIKVKSQQLSASGAPIAIRVALALKEWIPDSQSLATALSLAALSPLGIVNSSTGNAEVITQGVSALLSVPTATGASGPNLEANDVPASVIVRSTAR